MALPTVGSVAPDFTLQDQDGKEHSLSHYKGKYVLVYFYPKDDTPGCTKEACSLGEYLPDFSKSDAVVLGISADSVASHRKFADKYGLKFTLLADPEKKAIRAYDVWGMKKFMGREYEGIFRDSFLVAPDGTIAKVYEGVKPEQHAAEVLADLEALRG
ncbi:MAG TPA: thioredoxin-dependent thiol peroxidase [Candidatus Paceibacterota bacterium]|jgi:peroxiredoxin Q/BCP|nr:thioredoxin-dependent thiol peroxidase [Candidatus Paceibacterota bacterium]